MSTPEDSQLDFKDPEEALHHMTKDHFDMGYSLQLWVVSRIVIVMLRMRTSDVTSLATQFTGQVAILRPTGSAREGSQSTPHQTCHRWLN